MLRAHSKGSGTVGVALREFLSFGLIRLVKRFFALLIKGYARLGGVWPAFSPLGSDNDCAAAKES